MSTSKSTNKYNRHNWEDSEFPIVCQTCLGDNPYLRMLKDRYGDECKVCTRPFTSFKWCPGSKMRYKRTEICQLCAKLKNVCQTCLLDLEYGLPTQVRDTILGSKDNIPKSDVNLEYYRNKIERELVGTDPTKPIGPMVGKTHTNHALLQRLARTKPYYERNRPHICSFWVKGECKRGEECPFRHEMPGDPNDPLSFQNIRDRYYGVNDPVAEKLLNKASEMPKLEPPSDKTLKTLYIGGIDNSITEDDLRHYFYQYGEIKQISIADKHACAFITFAARSSAELAIDASYNRLVINGTKLNVQWGKSQSDYNAPGTKGGIPLVPVPYIPECYPNPFYEPERFSTVKVPSLYSTVPPPPPPPTTNPKGKNPIHYPSQDPHRLGTSYGSENK